MRRASQEDRKPTQQPFQVDVMAPGFKDAGGPSDRIRFSAETRSAAERDKVVEVVRKLAANGRWDVLRARMEGRFTTRELTRAASQLGETYEALLARTAPAPEQPLLAPQIDAYLQMPTRTTRPRKAEGIHKVRMQLDRFVEFLGGPKVALISHLTEEKINAFLAGLTNQRTGAPADPKTKNRYRAAISGLATHCQRRNLLSRHPIREGLVAKQSENGGERMPDWFGPEDFKRYFAAVAEISLRMVLFLKLMIFTGVDLEEMLELRVADLQFQEGHGVLTSRRSKVDGKERVIPFDSSVKAEFEAHVAEYNLKPHQPLFGMLTRVRTKSGVSAYEVNAAHRAGRKALGRSSAHEATKAGIEHDGRQTLRLKDLRHIAAIGWVRAGINLVEVQHYLGHTSITQTQVYARYTPKEEQFSAAVKALQRAFHSN